MPVAFVPVPLCWQGNMQFTQEGQQVENVFHVKTTGPMSVADGGAVGVGVYNWWVARLKPIVSSTVQLQQVVMTDLSSQTGTVVVIPAAPNTTGNLGGSHPP